MQYSGGDQLTFLEARSVSRPVEMSYVSLMERFTEWSRQKRLPLKSVAERDRALAEYGNHMYFAGHTAADFSRVRAAAAFHWTDVSKAGKELHRAQRAQIGFCKKAPDKSRLPIPLVVACAVAKEIVSVGDDWRAAAAVMMQFVLYLRPGEVLSIRARDLQAPLPRHSGGLAHWSVLLHPAEAGVASKTGVFDEAMVMDNPDYLDLVQVWRRLKREKSEMLFPFSYSRYAKVFSEAVERLDLAKIGVVHLYQLRHGGVSHEVATGRRSIESAQKRGRWACLQSMRRYGKGGRIMDMLGRMNATELQHAQACRDRVGKILAGICRPVPRNVVKALPYSSSRGTPTSLKRGAAALS